MKYLHKYNKYNLTTENKNNFTFEKEERDKLLPDLVDIMSDFIDDGVSFVFESSSNRITVNDFIDKNEGKLENFKPVYKAGNKIKSLFYIRIFPNPRCDYKKFSEMVNDMIPSVGRIEDMGWVMGSFEKSQDQSGRFTSLSYNFTKPDIITEGKLPTIEEIKSKFENFGLNVEDIEYELDNNMCHVGAESNAYNGRIPDDIEDKLDRMIQELGFDYYEHEVDTDWLSVKFWINPVKSED